MPSFSSSGRQSGAAAIDHQIGDGIVNESSRGDTPLIDSDWFGAQRRHRYVNQGIVNLDMDRTAPID